MIWVYVTIAIGAAVILAWVIIDYLNVVAILRPLVDNTQSEIGQSEESFKVENCTIEMVEREIGELKAEITVLEGKVETAKTSIDDFNLKKQRRAPTSQKLD
jgi:hypothetical protein